MKSNEFSNMTNVELADKLASLKAELFNLRFAHATNSLSNPLQLKNCKRDIARVKTIIRERELGISKAPAATEAKPAKKAEKPAKKTAAKKAIKG
ncbi:MAG: 50S ribosomal protein L29 [Clostridia bacterium]|nr:50S ribosomal protein L29 [Clostridia bacterium]